MDSIKAIETDLAECARKYDALEVWPDLATQNVESLVCDDDNRCGFVVLEIGNPQGATQLYFSGEVHGDERVGPHAVLEAARLLCSNLTDVDLSDTLVVMTPLTNPLGYALGERGELGRDPNRDFPYDQSPEECLDTVSARVVHRIFHHYGHIEAGITFHGGEQSITYPWGSTSHEKEDALDTPWLHMIAEELQRVSGGPQVYEIGSMGKVVYPVKGGMEDWAYALGFESTVECKSRSFGGYSVSKSVGLPSAAMFLVESTNEKTPPEKELSIAVPRCVSMILSLIRILTPSVTVLPLVVEGGKVLLVYSGYLADLQIDHECAGQEGTTEISDFFIPMHLSTCETLHVSDRLGLSTQQGHLKFIHNRRRRVNIPKDLEPAVCFQVLQQYFVCLSKSVFVLHPYLLQFRPTVEIFSDTHHVVLVPNKMTNTLPGDFYSGFIGIKFTSDRFIVNFPSAHVPAPTVLLIFVLPIICLLAVFFRPKRIGNCRHW